MVTTPPPLSVHTYIVHGYLSLSLSSPSPEVSVNVWVTPNTSVVDPCDTGVELRIVQFVQNNDDQPLSGEHNSIKEEVRVPSPRRSTKEGVERRERGPCNPRREEGPRPVDPGPLPWTPSRHGVLPGLFLPSGRTSVEVISEVISESFGK